MATECDGEGVSLFSGYLQAWFSADCMVQCSRRNDSAAVRCSSGADVVISSRLDEVICAKSGVNCGEATAAA